MRERAQGTWELSVAAGRDPDGGAYPCVIRTVTHGYGPRRAHQVPFRARDNDQSIPRPAPMNARRTSAHASGATHPLVRAVVV